MAPARTLTAATGDSIGQRIDGAGLRIPEIVLGFPIGNCAVGSALCNEETCWRLVVSLAKDSQLCWIENIERTTNELENLTP